MPCLVHAEREKTEQVSLLLPFLLMQVLLPLPFQLLFLQPLLKEVLLEH